MEIPDSNLINPRDIALLSADDVYKEIMKQNGYKVVTEAIRPSKVITIQCRDNDNTLEDLLNYIKSNGNTGHSFSIVVDPDDKERRKEFGWDGDGSDSIRDIKVKQELK